MTTLMSQCRGTTTNGFFHALQRSCRLGAFFRTQEPNRCFACSGVNCVTPEQRWSKKCLVLWILTMVSSLTCFRWTEGQRTELRSKSSPAGEIALKPPEEFDWNTAVSLAGIFCHSAVIYTIFCFTDSDCLQIQGKKLNGTRMSFADGDWMTASYGATTRTLSLIRNMHRGNSMETALGHCLRAFEFGFLRMRIPI